MIKNQIIKINGHVKKYINYLTVQKTLTEITSKEILRNLYNKSELKQELDILTKFEDIISPIIEKLRDSIFEQNILSELRDTLLPQLISGRLRIQDPENFLTELEALEILRRDKYYT